MKLSLIMVIFGVIMSAGGVIVNSTDYTILGNLWTVGGLVISKIENK